MDGVVIEVNYQPARIIKAISEAKREGQSVTHIGVTPKTATALGWILGADVVTNFLGYPVKLWSSDALLRLRKPHAKLCFSGYDELPIPCT